LPKATAVHGDFHAGQLIMDSAGRVWLLDLEDLATGAPESDLGNFAAHLATRPETRRGPIQQGFEHWLGHTLEAYRSIGGVGHSGLAHSHGRIALIRRALKLRERGDPSVLSELAGR
jgi:aminoglycoside phosphotransferase (APT) family kinase protein